ncbi:MAG TPA: class I SAM-dependent methyltransferase [Halomicronema sp.]
MSAQESPLPSQSLPIVTEPNRLQGLIANRLDSWTVGKGEISWPCVPSLTDEYLHRLEILFRILGKPWSSQELARLRELLATKLKSGFEVSPHSRLLIKFETDKFPSIPTNRLGLGISTIISTLEDEYKKWTQLRQPPLFGSHPDAKVMSTVEQLGQDPSTVAILDVGAGTGRNTFPLARLGYTVQALEPVPAFVQQMAVTTQAEGLPVIVTQGNVLDENLVLPQAHFKLAIVVEVVSHFRVFPQLQQFLQKMSEVLRPGGLLLFNTFLPVEGYEPTQVVREMSQVMWCSVFTRSELMAALKDLPFELVSDQSAYEFERQNLPAQAWPPTGWFEQWATGRDLFPISDGLPPVQLRWLLYRRL